jgi:hypothetical protein
MSTRDATNIVKPNALGAKYTDKEVGNGEDIL